MCAAQKVLPESWMEGGTGDYSSSAWLQSGSHDEMAGRTDIFLDCALPASLREERLVSFSCRARDDLIAAVRGILLTRAQMRSGVQLSQLHTLSLDGASEQRAERIPAPLWQAGVLAGHVLPPCNKAKAKARRKWWARARPERAALRDAYTRFVRGVLAPAVSGDGGDIEACVFQRRPILRVVFPTKESGANESVPHRDADYRHQAEELNCWIPLSRPIARQSSLYVESAPNVGDWHAWNFEGSLRRQTQAEEELTGVAVGGEEEAGECVVWWGNACRHFSLPNTTTTTRVSIDCRIVPPGLWQGDRGEISDPDGTLLQLGGYYARLSEAPATRSRSCDIESESTHPG